MCVEGREFGVHIEVEHSVCVRGEGEIVCVYVCACWGRWEMVYVCVCVCVIWGRGRVHEVGEGEMVCELGQGEIVCGGMRG